MVLLKESFVRNLDEFFSSWKRTVLYVIASYLWGVGGTIITLFDLNENDLLVPQGEDKNMWFSFYVVNVFASYASTAMIFNSILSIVMSIGGSNKTTSFVALFTSGVTKIEYFYPHSIIRNIFTRPFVIGVMYTLVVVFDVSTFSPHYVSDIITPRFIAASFLTSTMVGVVQGIIVVATHKILGADIFVRESVIGIDDEEVTTTSTVAPEEIPQEEYQPPKLESYFSMSV